MDMVECGAAVLAIILAYYGRIVPLPQLRQDCGVSRDGTNALDIIRAARNYGLIAQIFKKGLRALQDLPPPFIVFWNFNHFVVVEGFSEDSRRMSSRGYVWINDPATGRRRVSLKEFDKAYTGIALLMKPGSAFAQGGARPSVVSSLQKRLTGFSGALLYCLLVGLLLTIPGLVIPVLTQVFIDSVVLNETSNWERPLFLGILLSVFAEGVLAWLRLTHLKRLRIALGTKMSSRFLWHILRLPLKFYTQRYAGEIASRLSLNDKIADVLSGRLTTTIVDAIVIVLYALVMFQYDAILALIAIAFALTNFLALQAVSRRRIDDNIRFAQESGVLTGISTAGISTIETLKASGLESHFFSRLAGHQARTVSVQQEINIPNRLLGILPDLLNGLATTSVLIIGGLRAIDGHLSIGMLVAFQNLMLKFLQPVGGLVSLGSTLQELVGDLDRLDDVLANSTDECFGQSGASHNTPVPIKDLYEIQLKDVTFGYRPGGLPLIERFNLSLKKGQRVAIVGVSGSGKSTLAHLVAGLDKPWSGEVLINGYPQSHFSKGDLARLIAIVQQDISLFEGTVHDNLTLWDSTISQESLLRACHDAAIDEVIRSLPGGYYAELCDGGAGLSGGERQRLEIARALALDPVLLLLDEATSALDAETEQIVMENVCRRGCACLVIAHRLSTIRDCDEILVLEAGKIVQRGTHTELRQVQGLYSWLIASDEEA
jgi:ATP-binding cassette subfamily C protein